MPKALPVTRGRKFLQVLEGARTIFLRDGFEGAAVDALLGEIDEKVFDLDREAGKAGRVGREEFAEVAGSDRAAMILHGLPCGGSNRRHGFASETHANRSTDLCMTPIH